MANPYITKVFHFCAAHQYGHTDWSDERNWEIFGPDARVHGHNYALEVTVTGPINSDTGFCIDLGELKKIVDENIIAQLDHSQIEKDVAWFKGRQPSSENMVQFIWEEIASRLKGPKLYRVRLRETPTIFTDYYGKDI
ncbi:MAG: 6-carboxytetrahydropterin synthase [Calditrichia bacterium]|nr:6-carboxytetrahydropterin synthase [Calditrichia bacterium]MCK5330595.1 6-carboxytetrahydropterin synthase [Candidatus Neomarinimicrobiota bacterium]